MQSLIYAYFEAINWGQIQDAACLLADDCLWHVPALAQTFRGGQGYLAYRRAWRTAFADGWVEIQDLKLAADWACCCYLHRGTHKGRLQSGFGVLLPTGRKVALSVCEVYEMSDGRFSRIHTYFDLTTLTRPLNFSSSDRQSQGLLSNN